jgi:hypothetical protein
MITRADRQRHALYGEAFGDLQAYSPRRPGDQRRFNSFVHCALPSTAFTVRGSCLLIRIGAKDGQREVHVGVGDLLSGVGARCPKRLRLNTPVT